jgi:hypothetical protein
LKGVKASDFLRAAQAKTARSAASASATRGQGRGTVKEARSFFCTLDLRRFGITGDGAFRTQLDAATEELRLALPPPARNWGLARKLVNIFLRDALYTTHLCEKFHLDAAEEFYEIPLDSITSDRLRKSPGGGVLPRWNGVKYLSSDASDRYRSRPHVDSFNRKLTVSRRTLQRRFPVISTKRAARPEKNVSRLLSSRQKHREPPTSAALTS